RLQALVEVEECEKYNNRTERRVAFPVLAAVLPQVAKRKNTIILRTQLCVRVHRIIERLSQCEGRELRRALFSLKQIFQDDKDLVHEFVNNDGLACLIKIAANTDQNHPNYILRALGQVMIYVDGMNGVIKHNETIQWLYSLVASQYRLVVKTALKLLLVFVEYSHSNCLLMAHALRAVDGQRGTLLWTNVMHVLESNSNNNNANQTNAIATPPNDNRIGSANQEASTENSETSKDEAGDDGEDQELLVYAISLINKTLAGIADKDTFYDLVDPLEEAGIERIIGRLLTKPRDTLDPLLVEQLSTYERVLSAEDGCLTDAGNLSDVGDQSTSDSPLMLRKRPSLSSSMSTLSNSRSKSMANLRLNHLLSINNSNSNSNNCASPQPWDSRHSHTPTRTQHSSVNGNNSDTNRRRSRRFSASTIALNEMLNSNSNNNEENSTHVTCASNNCSPRLLCDATIAESELMTETESATTTTTVSQSDQDSGPEHIITQAHDDVESNKEQVTENQPASQESPAAALLVRGAQQQRASISSCSSADSYASTASYGYASGASSTCGNADHLINGPAAVTSIVRDMAHSGAHVTSAHAMRGRALLPRVELARDASPLRLQTANGAQCSPMSSLSSCHSPADSGCGSTTTTNTTTAEATAAGVSRNTPGEHCASSSSSSSSSGISVHSNDSPPASIVIMDSSAGCTHPYSNSVVNSRAPSGSASDSVDVQPKNKHKLVLIQQAPIVKGNTAASAAPTSVTLTTTTTTTTSSSTTTNSGSSTVAAAAAAANSALHWEQVMSGAKAAKQRKLCINELDFSDLVDDSEEEDANSAATTAAAAASAAGIKSPISADDLKSPPPPPGPPVPLHGLWGATGSNTMSGGSSLLQRQSSLSMSMMNISSPNNQQQSNGLVLANGVRKNKKTMKLFWKEVPRTQHNNNGASVFSTQARNANGSHHRHSKHKKTIWDEIEPAPIDCAKLEMLFESKAKELHTIHGQHGLLGAKLGDHAGDGEHGPLGGARVLTVLDTKRSNAINIGMTKLPPMRVIKAAILRMDSSIMSRENIEKILTTMMPSDEEKTKIIEAQLSAGDAHTPLGTAEQFLLNLASISCLEARLKLWAFQLDYATAEREIAEPLMDLKMACQEIESSRTFRVVLSTLLAIGNFLNASNARGFNIDYLAKVPEVKDTVHKHSLLHHLCQFILERYPSQPSNQASQSSQAQQQSSQQNKQQQSSGGGGGAATSASITTANNKQLGDLYSEFGAVNRASKVDFTELAKQLDKLQHDCRASWDYLKLVAKHDGLSNVMQLSSCVPLTSNNDSSANNDTAAANGNINDYKQLVNGSSTQANQANGVTSREPAKRSLKIGEFLAECAERIGTLRVVHRRVTLRFQRLLAYLGCSPTYCKTTPPHHVLKIINEFALEYRMKRERVLEMMAKKAQHIERNKTRGKLIVGPGSNNSLSCHFNGTTANGNSNNNGNVRMRPSYQYQYQYRRRSMGSSVSVSTQNLSYNHHELGEHQIDENGAQDHHQTPTTIGDEQSARDEQLRHLLLTSNTNAGVGHTHQQHQRVRLTSSTFLQRPTGPVPAHKSYQTHHHNNYHDSPQQLSSRPYSQASMAQSMNDDDTDDVDMHDSISRQSSYYRHLNDNIDALINHDNHDGILESLVVAATSAPSSRARHEAAKRTRLSSRFGCELLRGLLVAAVPTAVLMRRAGDILIIVGVADVAKELSTVHELVSSVLADDSSVPISSRSSTLEDLCVRNEEVALSKPDDAELDAVDEAEFDVVTPEELVTGPLAEERRSNVLAVVVVVVTTGATNIDEDNNVGFVVSPLTPITTASVRTGDQSDGVTAPASSVQLCVMSVSAIVNTAPDELSDELPLVSRRSSGCRA
ncbi:FH1/FH2 domain-containing protein 3, partial [Fragariocoptes setiger]